MLGAFTCVDMRFVMVHCSEQIRGVAGLASLPTYDIICIGHSHRFGIEYSGEFMFILFGEGEKTGCSVLDLTGLKIQRIHVGKCMFDQEIPI